MQMICQNRACGKEFEAKRKTAKYCSRRCSMAASRAGDQGDPTPAEPGQRTGRAIPVSELERWTRTALGKVGRVDTWAGQAALVLAARIDIGGAETGSALASMIKEHAAAMDRALAEASSGDPVEQLQDEVAKRRREHTNTGAG